MIHSSMDYENVDLRVFMRSCDSNNGRTIYNRNCDSTNDIKTSTGNSVIPTVSRNISYHAPISRSVSVNNETPIKLITENFAEEIAPLQRKRPSAKYKKINYKNHKCTDVLCLLIFICFIIAWVYVAGYAFYQGNLNKILMPTDSKNAKCGLDSGVRDKKMLFFFNLDKCLDPMMPITGCDTKQICIESCPQTSFAWNEIKIEQRSDLEYLKEKLICDGIFDKSNLKSLAHVKRAIQDDNCSGRYLKSKPLFNHCIWDFSDNICDLISWNFINITHFNTKFAEFVESTRSLCRKRATNSTSSLNVVALQERIEQSNSSFNRIIAAITSKLNYSGKEILSEHIAIDLKNTWKVLIFAFVIHICAVLLFITLLRWLAGPLVWISIGGIIIGMSIFFVYSFNQYRFWSKEPHVPHHATHLLAKVKNVFETGDVWFYVTIVLGVLLTIILLILLVIRKRIKIAVAVIKEASKAITNIKSSILFPIFPGILYIIVASLSIIIMLYLSSVGDFSFIVVRRNHNDKNGFIMEECICTGPKPYKLGDPCNPALFEEYCHIDKVSKCVETSCSFSEISKSQKTQWFMVFNVFAFLWLTFFISAYEDMVLACTFSIWYWTFNKKNIPKLPLLKAIWITTFYHMGTLAFGSLILSICRIIRYVLELIEKKAKIYNNKVTRAIICCMQCLFWLLENFLRFLNRNAYITCAIHSTSFCKSSKKAFNLITQNILRVYAVDKVSDFLLFLSKILVTGCTSCITYFFLKMFPTIIPIHYPAVPVVLVAVIAYIMAYSIFSTYSIAVDTLFFCFLEDSTENDGSAENPFYMSKELKKLLRRTKIKRKQQPRK